MQETSFLVEILIHDDASTDGTDDIIREYAAKYPNLIFPLFEEENKYSNGYANKMDFFNYERARGKYIAYCEGDDYWTDPLKLQKQVDFMEKHPEYSVCFHDNSVYDVRSGRMLGLNDFDGYEVAKAVTSDGVNMSARDYFFRTIGGQPLTMLFRLSMFDFDWHNQYQHYRDTHEIYHLLCSGKGYWMSFNGGVYVKHDGGVSTSVLLNESCREVREIMLELYLNTKDKLIEDCLVDAILWSYDTCVSRKDVLSLYKSIRKNWQIVPKIACKVYFVIAKRKLKKRVKRCGILLSKQVA